MALALASMTGFAREESPAPGAAGYLPADAAWVWEIRSVNSRGLEFRVRLPNRLEALEPALRGVAARRLRRGSVQATLTVQAGTRAGWRVNRAWLDTLVLLAQEVAGQMPGAPTPRVELLLGLPGVVQAESAGEPPAIIDEQQAAVIAGFDAVVERLVASREAEGERLGKMVHGLLDQFAAVRARAAALAAAQPEAHRARLMRSVGELLRAVPALPEERLVQEVALLAARSDVQEELDRLESHLAGARDLIARGGPVGRDLDFLVQEFMREINTLCSKSGDIELTGAGLQMKAIMEQVREQVQNLE